MACCCPYFKEYVIFGLLILNIFSFFSMVTIPGSLEESIIQEFKVSTSQYANLVSLSSWASLIDVIHGYLLDRYMGIKLATLIYNIITILGCVVCVIACYTMDFGLLMGGRALIGIGENPMMLCANKHMIRWFGAGKYVNFVYSTVESTLWLGAAVTFLVSVRILTYVESVLPHSNAFATTFASETVFLTLVMVITSSVMASMYNCKEVKNDEKALCNEDKQKEMSKKLGFKDFVGFPPIFWMFAITIFIYYVSINSLINMSQVYLKTTYHLSTSYASILSAIINAMAAFLSPVMGLLIDKVGHNLSFLTLAFALNTLSHCIFSFTSANPLIPVILMGCSLVCSSGIWSQFQFLVKEHQLMIAYGVVQTGCNAANAVGSIISGVVVDKYGYTGFMEYLLLLIIVAIPLLCVLWILNYKHKDIMNSVSSKKREIQEIFNKEETKEEGSENKGYGSENSTTLDVSVDKPDNLETRPDQDSKEQCPDTTP